MKKNIFKGCATAIVTPFDENNNINFIEFERLIEFQIANDVNAIVVCGTTGESATLSQKEKNDLISFCIKIVNRRVPVIAGVGCNNTKEVIENAKFAENAGADALLIVTPYYNKTTQDGIIKHYEIIAQNTKLPIIVYNVPSRTGIDIKPETYLKLSKIQNIVAIKEACGDISKVLKIQNLCNDNLDVYSGNDDQIIPFLSLGGSGVISVLSNIKPKETSKMINEYWKGNVKIATKMQIELSGLIDDLFKEVNPIPIKKALQIIGFNCGNPRLPLIECSADLSEQLKNRLLSNKID